MIEDRKVTIAEASKLLGVPKWRLYRLARPSDDEPQRLWPVEVLRSSGCKGGLAYFWLSEIANALADEREEIERRRAERAAGRNTCV